MSKEMMQTYDIVDSDVLVIGAGLAGANAAIEAAKNGCHVVLVDKGFVGKTGISAGNSFGATMAMIREPDTKETLVQEMLTGGRNLNRREIVELFAEEIAKGSILEMEKMGVIFRRDQNNNIMLVRFGGQAYPRTASFSWQNAPAMMRVGMVPEAIRLGVRSFDKMLVTMLLLDEGKVVGAYALDMKNGSGKVFRAKATILTAGNAALLFGYRAGMMTTGDGYSVAYRAGASLRDMEFISCSLGLANTKLFPGLFGEPPTLQSSSGEPGKMYNALNERFMEKYDPVLLEGCQKYKYMYAICNEVRNGRGTENGGIWFDYKALDKDAPFYGFAVNQLGPLGIDFQKEGRLEYNIAPYFFTGGVEYDTSHQSNLPGLFVAGEVSGGLHGAERIPSTAIGECIVFGRRAGKCAAEQAMNMRSPIGINLNDIKREEERLVTLLNSNGSISSGEFRTKLRDIMWNQVGFIRERSRLSKAVEGLAAMRKDLNKFRIRSKGPRYNVDWIDAIENCFLTDVAEMVAKASLVREETRGAHCRDDFPKESDKFSASIRILKRGEEMVVG